ncbi:hypothetical protein JCM10212_005001 [Sporobolomyces blumeae]
MTLSIENPSPTSSSSIPSTAPRLRVSRTRSTTYSTSTTNRTNKQKKKKLGSTLFSSGLFEPLEQQTPRTTSTATTQWRNVMDEERDFEVAAKDETRRGARERGATTTTTTTTIDKRGRMRKGARTEDVYTSLNLDPFSAVPCLSTFTSSFAVQEYIATLVRRDASDVESIVTIPTMTTGGFALDEAERVDRDGRDGDLVEETLWIYEQLRRFIVDQQPWIHALSKECTCREMRASEWLYLCAAHATPPREPCSALSYTVHTSEGASALLTSPRYFPSRISLKDDDDADDDKESESSLLRRFVALNDQYALIEPEALVVPLDELMGGGPFGMGTRGELEELNREGQGRPGKKRKVDVGLDIGQLLVEEMSQGYRAAFSRSGSET